MPLEIIELRKLASAAVLGALCACASATAQPVATAESSAAVSPITFADIAPFILVGLVAQLIDGALGMAFGVISQTMLVSVLGVAPATASATTHLVEMFTSGASGASHIWHRNVDWGLFWRLAPFGVAGGRRLWAEAQRRGRGPGDRRPGP